MGVETLIGTTWLLRIGLGILAIALALFARLVAPQLSPPAKVALAYAGALAFMAVGKLFEARLDRFARPVMAGGLAFGFFVAYAAHFVPAMSAIPLTASIVWMVVSMLAVLAAAERWQSESTAILAIVLGHVSAQASAGAADLYALMMIGFLAVTALALLLRHRWIHLGLIGVAASYGAHFVWMLAERQPPPGNQGFWISLAFLTSYCLIFLVADILWWRREVDAETQPSHAERRDARALGPANLVLYVSLVTFVYVTSGATVDSIEWFYLTLGALQGVLAWFYHGWSHRDFVYHPIFGTVLWTMGMFAALDALVLDLVLASQALLLLLVARWTGLRVFYVLSQAAMVVAAVHYLFYPGTAEPPFGAFVGGLGIAAVYLAKAFLEEDWYESIPLVAWLHAVMGGVVILTESFAYLAPDRSLGIFLATAQLGLAALALWRARPALLFAVTTVAAGMLPMVVTIPADSVWSAAIGFALTALALVHLGPERFDGDRKSTVVWHARAVALFVLAGAIMAVDGIEPSLAGYLRWMLLVPVLLAIQVGVDDVLAGSGPSAAPGPPPGPERKAGEEPLGVVATFTYLAIALFVIALTNQAFSDRLTEPVWVAIWATLCLMAAARMERRGPAVAGYALLAGGYLIFLNVALLSVPGPGSRAHPALGSWWAGTFLALLPLAIAWVTERRLVQESGAEGERPPSASASPSTLAATLGPYLLGLLVAGAVAAKLGSLGWMYLVPAAAGLILALAGLRADAPRAVNAAVFGAVFWHVHFLMIGAQAPEVESALSFLLLFALLTVTVERCGFRAMEGDGDRAFLAPILVGLVVLATLTAMAAVYYSNVLGPQWATAGWSVLGGSMMAGAFMLRSSTHRRVALAVLGLCIVRVFAVDTVGLSDTARIGAFFVLGLILVGIALLYIRFQEELQNWL